MLQDVEGQDFGGQGVEGQDFEGQGVEGQGDVGGWGQNMADMQKISIHH
jgi:hypothetical protein